MRRTYLAEDPSQYQWAWRFMEEAEDEPPKSATAPIRGIDLSRHWESIRKIILSKVVVPECLEREDVIQEVYLTIARRNSSPKSAFDPRRSGLANYVIMVARNVIGHLLERHQRRRIDDQVGLDDAEELAGEADAIGAWEEVELWSLSGEEVDRLRGQPTVKEVRRVLR